jgi:hypothetical protein
MCAVIAACLQAEARGLKWDGMFRLNPAVGTLFRLSYVKYGRKTLLGVVGHGRSVYAALVWDLACLATGSDATNFPSAAERLQVGVVCTCISLL